MAFSSHLLKIIEFIADQHDADQHKTKNAIPVERAAG